MKHLGHLIAHDLRRHRLLLIAWAVVVMTIAGIDRLSPMFPLDPESDRPVALLRILLSVLHVLLLLTIVPLLFHTHPAVGSDAFWLTRPLPVRSVLTSKALILIAAFVLLPAATEAAVMFGYAVPPRTLAAIVAQSALYNVLWVALLSALAALTGNLVRFALLFGSILTTLVLVVALQVARVLMKADDRPSGAGTLAPEDPTGWVVFIVLIFMTAIVVAVVQYWTRSRWRSLAAGAIGLTVAYVLPQFWPFPIWAHSLEVPAWAQKSPALQLSVSHQTIEFVAQDTQPFGGAPRWRTAQAPVAVSGVQVGWAPSVGVRRAEVTLPGARRLVSAIEAYPIATHIGQNGNEIRDSNEPLRRLLAVADLYPRVPESVRAPAVLMFAQEADFRPVVNTEGIYRGRFQVRLARQSIEARLPFRAGATHARDAYRFTILQVRRRGGGVAVLARESAAQSMFGRRPFPGRRYFARNIRRAQAIEGYPELAGMGDVAFPVAAGFHWSAGSEMHYGFSARRIILLFEPRERDQLVFEVEGSWLQDAELVITRTTMEGAVERSLEIADFPLREETAFPPKPAVEKTQIGDN
jgi:hypothetical protein